MKAVCNPTLVEKTPEVFASALAPEQAASSSGTGSEQSAVWTSLIGDQEWAVYSLAIEALRAAHVRFVLGGAFALAAYTGRCRNTKDMDLFLLPAEREAAIQALTQAGFSDYYEKVPYDRGWIYRATRGGMIVDLIWGTPNRRGQVDAAWFKGTREVRIRGESLEAMPAEELLWIKLYVLQRDRCDWPDVINLLYATSSFLDWDRVLARLNHDAPLLQGLVCVFSWLCPGRMQDVPLHLRQRWGLANMDDGAADWKQDRINYLDTRPWFAALQPCEKAMMR